jgi:hypothetical protein
MHYASWPLQKSVLSLHYNAGAFTPLHMVTDQQTCLGTAANGLPSAHASVRCRPKTAYDAPAEANRQDQPRPWVDTRRTGTRLDTRFRPENNHLEVSICLWNLKAARTTAVLGGSPQRHPAPCPHPTITTHPADTHTATHHEPTELRPPCT